MSLSVVVPIFRQAAHIENVLREYVRALSALKTDFEIVAVVNGGDTASRDACLATVDERSRLRVLFLEQPGWGRAVRAGLAAANGDLLCYTNSARSNGSMLAAVATYAMTSPGTVVMASRVIREGWRRKVASLAYNLECRAMFDLCVWDVNGTPKVFPRSFDRLLRLTRDDDLIDLEFNIACVQARYPVLQVPVGLTPRRGGRSTTNWKSAVRLYWGAYSLWRAARKAQTR